MNKYLGIIIDVLAFAFALFIVYLLWRFIPFFQVLSFWEMLFASSCGWIVGDIVRKNLEKCK